MLVSIAVAVLALALALAIGYLASDWWLRDTRPATHSPDVK